MGFLESLQKIGFGNRGPHGRMTSGATNFANYFSQRNALEGQRGVSKALALAAKNGQPISFATQSEISTKWGVPLNTVMQMAKGINQTVEAEKIKTQLQAMSQLYMSKKRADPSWKPTHKDLMQIASDAGVTDPRVLAIAKDAIVRLMPQSKLVAIRPGTKIEKLTTSLGGQTKAENVVENPIKPKDSWEQMPDIVKGNSVIMRQRNKKTGEIKYKTVPRGSEGKKKYGADVAKALDAISKGADPRKVYSRLIKYYPEKIKEIKSIILDPASLPSNVKDEVAQAVGRIQAGEDPNSEYRKLASKYPSYQKTIRGILLTPKTLENIDLSSLFNK